MEDTEMKNLIDELYDLDIFRLSKLGSEDSEYKSVFSRLVKLEAELLKAYPDCTDIFNEYQSMEGKLHSLDNRNEFRKGFQAGAQLVLEMIKPIK